MERDYLDDWSEHCARESYAATMQYLAEGPPRPKRQRKPKRHTLASVLREAGKVGASVASATIAVDGTVKIAFGGSTAIVEDTPESLMRLM